MFLVTICYQKQTFILWSLEKKDAKIKFRYIKAVDKYKIPIEELGIKIKEK